MLNGPRRGTGSLKPCRIRFAGDCPCARFLRLPARSTLLVLSDNVRRLPPDVVIWALLQLRQKCLESEFCIADWPRPGIEPRKGACIMDMKLEVVVIPVS